MYGCRSAGQGLVSITGTSDKYPAVTDLVDKYGGGGYQNYKLVRDRSIWAVQTHTQGPQSHITLLHFTITKGCNPGLKMPEEDHAPLVCIRVHYMWLWVLPKLPPEPDYTIPFMIAKYHEEQQINYSTIQGSSRVHGNSSRLVYVYISVYTWRY